MPLFTKLPEKGNSTTEIIDHIEAYVYKELKPLGFRKFGRTLHRFVSGDISQLINFQTGLYYKGDNGYMWVNTGIRVPECSLRSFNFENSKKCYHEYECTIQSRLGKTSGGINDTCFDLSTDPDKMANDILSELKEFVLPAFDVLSSREAILQHRRDYHNIDIHAHHLILLEECFIYGHLGDLCKAEKCFVEYYNIALSEYEHEKKYGKEIYLKKGDIVISGKQTIKAEKDGYYTLFSSNRLHLDYLEALAKELGFNLEIL